jgi:hypothetical protein
MLLHPQSRQQLLQRYPAWLFGLPCLLREPLRETGYFEQSSRPIFPVAPVMRIVGVADLVSFAQKVRNATNGSWWMVQVQPTKATAEQSCARSAPEERMKSL